MVMPKTVDTREIMSRTEQHHDEIAVLVHEVLS